MHPNLRLLSLLLLVGCANVSLDDFGDEYGAAICVREVRCGRLDVRRMDICRSELGTPYPSCDGRWDGATAAECIADFDELPCVTDAGSPESCHSLCIE